MNYTEFLKNVGEKASELSVTGMNTLSQRLEFDPTNISYKLLTLLILVGALFFFSKITNKLAKFTLIILTVFFIISIVISISQ